MADEVDNMVLRLLREIRQKQDEQGHEIAAITTKQNEHGRLLEGIVRVLGEHSTEIAVIKADVAGMKTEIAAIKVRQERMEERQERMEERQERMEKRQETMARIMEEGFRATATSLEAHDRLLGSIVHTLGEQARHLSGLLTIAGTHDARLLRIERHLGLVQA